MSAIPKLFSIGLAAALLLGGAGCRWETANGMQDITGTDRLEVTQLRADRQDRDSPGKTVRTVTPDFTGRVNELRGINSDAVGWLYVPGTTINDGVLQNPAGQNNDYYLNLDLYGNPDKNGVYCADIRIEWGSGRRADLPRNTTLYGHSWTDSPGGELFAQLKHYRDPDFAREHPYLFFSTGAENMAWEVFAVFDTHISLPYIAPSFSNSRFLDLMDLVYDASLYHYDVGVGTQDKILTLSTCVYSVEGHDSLPPINDYRFVIMARLVDPNEVLKTQAELAENHSPVSPDEIFSRVLGGEIRNYTYII